MRRRPIAAALLGTLMCGMLAAWSLARALPQFSDPCHRWGVSFSAGAELSIPPGGPCRAISETKAQAVARLAAINGGLLAALGAVLFIPAVLAGVLFGLFSFAALAFVVAAGWWPSESTASGSSHP